MHQTTEVQVFCLQQAEDYGLSEKGGENPGKGLLQGEAVKRRVQAHAFPGVITALKLLPGFKCNSNTSQLSASPETITDGIIKEYVAV